MARKINLVIIHCAATPNGKPFTVEDIDRWHQERGFRRSNNTFNPQLKAIGYHHLIYLDGSVHSGRSEDEIGAHCVGHNYDSVGVCLIGTDKFTIPEWTELSWLVTQLMQRYPQAKILGHRDLPNVHKACPGFDVATWLNSNRAGLEGHIIEV